MQRNALCCVQRREGPEVDERSKGEYTRNVFVPLFAAGVALGASRMQDIVGCRLTLFSSNRTTCCSHKSISEGICSVGGVDRGRLTPYYLSKCSESRAESVPLVRKGYLPTKML